MTTAARWTPRTYVTQTGKEPLDEVDGIKGVNAFRVFSVPYRLHTATVIRAHRDAPWIVTFSTVWPVRTYRYYLAAEAERAARDLISRKAGMDMQTFTGSQRLYMGTQRCPKRLSGGLCGQSAGIGTVWCEWHPLGRVEGT